MQATVAAHRPVLDTNKAEGEHVRSFQLAISRLARKPKRARFGDAKIIAPPSTGRVTAGRCPGQPTASAPLSMKRSAISHSSFGEPRMLAAATANRRLKYHSAPAET
jgi:hypothetical protein